MRLEEGGGERGGDARRRTRRAAARLRGRMQAALRAQGNTSTPLHRAVALGHAVLGALVLLHLAQELAALGTLPLRALGLLAAGLAALAGVTLADFVTGAVHFYVDNYPDDDDLFFGPIGVEFRRHHARMADIVEQQFANVNYAVGRVTLPALAILVLVAPPFPLAAFALAFLAGVYLCQSLHRWAHHVPGKNPPPRAIAWLQRHRLLLSFDMHVRGHHHRPWDASYTIVTGHLNPLLDRTRFWRRVERVLYERLGWEPDSWQHSEAVRRAALATGARPGRDSASA